MARYGEVLPRVAAPNLLTCGTPGQELEVRITYWADAPGKLQVYDGKQYIDVASLTGMGGWATAKGRVAKDVVLAPEADRGLAAGRTIMFAVDVPAVYVHSFEARTVQAE